MRNCDQEVFVFVFPLALWCFDPFFCMQHFLPVHGEYAFLCEHAQLAQETAGIRNCSVIKNGTMLGVQQLRNAATVSTGSAAKVVGEVNLINFYNDGNKGTGTAQEMALTERTTIAFEGIVVVALDIFRGGASGTGGSLGCRCRLTTRAMWTDNGRLLEELHGVAEGVVSRLSYDASLSVVERRVIDAVRNACKKYNSKLPEVIVIAHENDPRVAHIPTVAAAQKGRSEMVPEGGRASGDGTGAGSRSRGTGSGAARVWQKPSSSAPPWKARTPDEQSEGEGRSSSGEEEADVPERGSGLGPAAIKARLLEVRKKAVDSRNLRKAAEAPHQDQGASGVAGPPSSPLPEGVIEQRRRRNPRDADRLDGDAAYD